MDPRQTATVDGSDGPLGPVAAPGEPNDPTVSGPCRAPGWPAWTPPTSGPIGRGPGRPGCGAWPSCSAPWPPSWCCATSCRPGAAPAHPVDPAGADPRHAPARPHRPALRS